VTPEVQRLRMVDRYLRSRGISDPLVLEAFARVPREEFVPLDYVDHAYDDSPLPIGSGQTISQPYVVALTLQALALTGRERVLEIGTGSGYQAAVLAQLVEVVYTVERIDELQRSARRRFRKLGIDNVKCRYDDGRIGWAEHAPFDAIIVTAAAAAMEPALIEQLAPGGVLIAPVGGSSGQQLLRLRRGEEGVSQEVLGAVVFVPLLGGTT
jgi:protein-L-isoaspartate(D-aspartate) O-methyltransferase